MNAYREGDPCPRCGHTKTVRIITAPAARMVGLPMCSKCKLVLQTGRTYQHGYAGESWWGDE